MYEIPFHLFIIVKVFIFSLYIVSNTISKVLLMHDTITFTINFSKIDIEVHLIVIAIMSVTKM
jgi:hypothetical protein